MPSLILPGTKKRKEILLNTFWALINGDLARSQTNSLSLFCETKALVGDIYTGLLSNLNLLYKYFTKNKSDWKPTTLGLIYSVLPVYENILPFLLVLGTFSVKTLMIIVMSPTQPSQTCSILQICVSLW